jgi:hypothetical protein
MKVWNYATQYTEWDCASIGGIVTLAENPALVSTATFAGATSVTNLIPDATVTVSSSGGGNGNNNGINGNGNTQNDGNTYNYYGKGAASGYLGYQVDAAASGLSCSTLHRELNVALRSFLEPASANIMAEILGRKLWVVMIYGRSGV